MRKHWLMATILLTNTAMAQQKMTPELLWQLGRVNGEALSADGKSVLYSVTHYDKDQNKGSKHLFSIPLAGGPATQLLPDAGNGDIAVFPGKTGFSRGGQYWEMNPDGSNAIQKTSTDEGMDNIRLSPDGQYILFSREVAVKKVNGKDIYPDLPKTTAQIYDHLDYRHWDTWEDGKFQHVFYAPYNNGQVGTPIDLLEGQPFDCPQMPYGGAEDLIWAPDGKSIVYVTKKRFGKEYATSTNTGIYEYNLAGRSTKDLAEGLNGYDVAPAFSPDGKYIAWLSMAHDGYESDKNDIVVLDRTTGSRINLTKDWDGTVGGIQWSRDGKKIYFVAPIKGTEQLFEIAARKPGTPHQVTDGNFDVAGILGQAGNTLVVSRTDFNHAAELYTVDLKNGQLKQLTTVNDDINKTLGQCKSVKRWITTTDNKQMLAWVVYPPDFDSTKKYPTLLYCQGGPQSALTQFYSFRWNFQLIASQGYIVVAPNRRGMPGHGVEWNAAISKDWGGQPIRDYLSAIDDVAKESYVDKARLGAVGASYGGYSVYMLAGVHNNRFKTFIAHDGLFDLRSWYGTTEELWFANWDIGAYWDHANAENIRKFNPSEYVNNWNTPILVVQGGIDFRVPIEQGLQAFQAAQLKGIKSKLLYFPDENHWVLHNQNALVWQREFFSWLKETL